MPEETPVGDVSRPCSVCGRWDVRFYLRHRDGKVYRRSQCCACEASAVRQYQIKNSVLVATAARRWRKANPDKMRLSWLKNRILKLGYTDPEPIMKWIEQHGDLCDICGRNAWGDRWANLHLDHDKETGDIRGMLCAFHNLGLGHFDHDVDLLKKAIEYLQRESVFQVSTCANQGAIMRRDPGAKQLSDAEVARLRAANPVPPVVEGSYDALEADTAHAKMLREWMETQSVRYLKEIALGMPYRSEGTKAEVIEWLLQYGRRRVHEDFDKESSS